MTEHLSSIVVAIPVKDEAERIGSCLRALSQQSGILQYQIVLLLNNCTDDSGAVVRALAPNLPIPVHQFEVTLPPEHANAGYARRLAMQAAEDFVAPEGVLLTTDADACVYPNWIATNLLALRQGADAVAGCIEIDPAERDSLACNVLALGHSRLLAIEENPSTNARLRQAGFDVRTFPGSELCINGSGGPTCLTRPLLRS